MRRRSGGHLSCEITPNDGKIDRLIQFNRMAKEIIAGSHIIEKLLQA
jgi:hypothetical protein